jgi:pimeloyl-ACP methyl ester carboxylesterase
MRKLITIGDVSLSYVQKNSSFNNTIIFLHGNSSSASSWNNQFSDSALDEFNLIAPDLPAHGESSANADGDYSLKYVKTLLAEAVIQLTNGKPFLLVGFSLSSNIAVEMLQEEINPEGMVLISPCIIGHQYPISVVAKPQEKTSPLFLDDADEDFLNDYFSASLYSKSMDTIKLLVNDYYKVKHSFRSIFINSVLNGGHSDEIELLKKYHKPVLIIFGKDEAVLNQNYLDNSPFKLWKNTIFKIPRAGHYVHLEQPHEVNKLITEYATELLK